MIGENKKKCRKKRFFAFLLCFVMFVSSLNGVFPTSVIAASDASSVETEQMTSETESETALQHTAKPMAEAQQTETSQDAAKVETQAPTETKPATETETTAPVQTEVETAVTEALQTEQTENQTDFSDVAVQVQTEAVIEAETTVPETPLPETAPALETLQVPSETEQEDALTEAIPEEGESEPAPQTETEINEEEKTEETDTENSKEEVEFDFCHRLENGEIRIHADKGVLPEGTTVEIKPLSDKVYDQAVSSVEEWTSAKPLIGLIGYDICFYDADGNELHQFGQNIKITYFRLDGMEEAEEMQVFHADEQGNVTEPLTDILEASEQVTFNSDQFSPIILAVYGDEEVKQGELNDPVNAVNDTVQVTFVIQDTDYTKDPGSGNTHLTVKNPIEGGDLTYTSWAGRYKVTGIGTLTSYTVPAGTSLSENGLSFPALSVTNIGNENTYSYSSLQSWVNAQGMVWSTDTALNEDTVLTLSLYQTGESYHLDFVCCEEENLSITYYLSRSITFKLGQSLSEEVIPSYEEVVNSGFTSDTHDLEGFAGWKLKVTNTGELVDLHPGMPLTAEHLEAQYGSAIKVYAVWKEVPTDPEETEETEETEEIKETEETEETEKTEETEEIKETEKPQESQEEYVNLILHDVLPNGEDSGYMLDLSVEAGIPLSEALTNADAVWEDGTALSDCIWYTVAADGTKNQVDLTSTVTGDMELFTYTYDAAFTLRTGASDAGTQIFKTTVREGHPLSASNLVMNGVDYSLCQWMDEDGDSLDIRELIQNGLTENVSAVTNGSLSVSGLTPYAGHNVNFYVFVNGERVLLETRRLTSYYRNSRYYLSAATLESVYKDYGFTSADLITGTRYFPHVDAGGSKIWADTAVMEWNGGYYSPINNNTGNVDVYYLPNQSIANTGQYQDYLTTESFYTVRVEDIVNKVYEKDEIPETTYTPYGGTVVMTVRNPENANWECIGQDGTKITGTANADGTMTFTVAGISQPYVISPALNEWERVISYDINLPQTPVDTEYGTPLIGNGSTLNLLETAETHMVLSPSLISYFYESEKYLGEATFLGWAVNGNTDDVIGPGEPLDLSQYDGTVSLQAMWETKLGGTSNSVGSMVNFFVSLDALPEGSVSWTGNTETSNFTSSVYTVDCGVDASVAVQQGLYDSVEGGQYFVLGGTSGTNLDNNHQAITDNLTAGYAMDGANGSQYVYRAGFPSDEEVLLKIRQMVANGTRIAINGHQITVDELTSENFTIKWYVFKYDQSDGWHIDGILVAKTGEMVVTKTFAGDADAIQDIMDQYSISVAGESGATHTGATLTPDNASEVNGNTLTWVVEVDQYFNYTVTENNYVSDGSLVTTIAQYNVQDSVVDGQNTDGWLNYDTGVTVTGSRHQQGTQECLTVSFLNTYTAPGTLVLRKVDAATGNLMPNITFSIQKDGSPNFGVYPVGGHAYTADPAGQTGEMVTEVTTDESGQAYLYIGGGTYTFTETVPDGYDDPGEIVAELEGNTENAYRIVTITSVSAENGEQFVEKDNLTLTVKNYSRTVDLAVEKIWADKENTPVTLQLYRSGNSMGNAYRVTLDGTTDAMETKPWRSVFTGLPLYSDGGLAQYSIREVVLGDFHYSDEYPDGYQYYNVSYSGMSYLDADGNATDVMADVRTVELKVTNRRSTGELIIEKVSEEGTALQDAVFSLYTMEGETVPTIDELHGQEPVKTAASDENGLVDFGWMGADEYYLMEVTAPDGYVLSDQIYRVMFDGSQTTVSQYKDGAWEPIADNRIVNVKQTTAIEIEKQVTGSLGDTQKAFQFSYQYVSGGVPVTGTFSLRDGETYRIENVPVGATLTLTEGNAEGYMVSGVYGTDGAVQQAIDGRLTFTVNAADHKIIITNHLGEIPDTDVRLDALPYILLLAMAVLGTVVLFWKRRLFRERGGS